MSAPEIKVELEDGKHEFRLLVYVDVTRAQLVDVPDLEKILVPGIRVRFDEELDKIKRPYDFRRSIEYRCDRGFDDVTRLRISCRGQYTDLTAEVKSVG